MTSSRVGAPLIEARNITKHYDGFTLQGVSLTVEPGQIVGFIGQNGAGKSTTIKALLGIIGIDAGDARILGVDARGLSGADAAVKERIGVVFDTVSMPPHIKIAEVGKLMERAYRNWDARVFEEYLHRFKLDSRKAIKELSRGMGMKLSLVAPWRTTRRCSSWTRRPPGSTPWHAMRCSTCCASLWRWRMPRETRSMRF